MVEKKENRNRIIPACYFLLSIIVILFVSLWIIKVNSENNNTDYDQAQINTHFNNKTSNSDFGKESSDSTKNISETVDDIEKRAAGTYASSQYYLIIQENGVVNIYFHSQDGSLTYFKQTEIPFNVLNNTDKEMITDGIIIDDIDKLNEFLQDYES